MQVAGEALQAAVLHAGLQLTDQLEAAGLATFAYVSGEDATREAGKLVETSGLDPMRDHVLAVGMVPVRRGAITLADALQTLVCPPARVCIPVETMRAHHIVPSEVQTAPALAHVLPKILERLEGAALLVQHAPLDVGFLKAGCRRAGRRWPRVAVVDTVDLLWKRAHRRRFAHPADVSVRSDPSADNINVRS